MTRIAAFFAVPLLALSALAAPAFSQPSDPTAPDAVVEYSGPDPVTVQTQDGPVAFTVEVADNDPARTRGMMHRDEVGPDEGMLFDFQVERPVSIWMANVRFPLDIIYIRSDGTIAKIADNAQPFSERSIPSDFPVLGVLEIAGGRADELNIRPGDVVEHPMFGNAQAPASGEAETDLADPEAEDEPAEDEPAEAETGPDAEDGLDEAG